MLHRQLGQNRGESRAANISDRFVVAAAVSAAEAKAFGTNASTMFLIRVTCDKYERAKRRPAPAFAELRRGKHGENRQPL